jgi:GGDEF domain-containing protein
MKANLSPGRSLDPISHDGIHDALTFLPAPAYFYEYLYREIAIIERSREPLTLMRLVITPKSESPAINSYEISIINFAKALNRSIRLSDLAARIGRYEFVLAVNSFQEAPTEIPGRIFSIWRDEEFTFSYSSAQYIEGDRALSLLGRLDSSNKYFL